MAKKMILPFGKTFGDAFESIEQKVFSISSPKNSLVSASAFIIPSQGTAGAVDMSALFKDLASAVIEHRLVFISYEGLHSKALSRREVEPYYLFFSPDGFWNLRAYCRLRDDWRVFALDRVRAWKVLERSFIPKFFADDVGRDFTSGFGTYMDGEVEEIVVHFSPEISPYVERRIWHPSQRSERLENGWLELRFVTSGTEGLKHWLYRWTSHFKVIKPRKLRDEIMADLERQKENLN